MVAEYLLKGIIIGIVFGVPVGVVGVLTIRRTITYGTFAGLASGLGCSVADFLYACISVFGLTLISDCILKCQNIVSLVGGALVITMGIGIIMKPKTDIQETAKTSQIISFFVSSFIIAVTNPATILSFFLAFSIFNIGCINSIMEGVGVVVGIFFGTCFWWVIIIIIIHIFRKYITDKILQKLNWILGGFIILFGAVVVIRAIL